MGCKWYIVRVSSGSEAKFVDAVMSNSERFSLQDAFQEAFIPSKEVIKVGRNGKKITTKQTLFSGYVFLCVDLGGDSISNESINFIETMSRSMFKACNFLKDDHGKPKVITCHEIEEMRKNISRDVVDDVKRVAFEVGDEVIINDGSFQNINGTVDCIKTNKEGKDIAVVTIVIFGRPINVDFELDCIEKR